MAGEKNKAKFVSNLVGPFLVSLPLCHKYPNRQHLIHTIQERTHAGSLTSNLTATADLNPLANMWSSRPSRPAYCFSSALLTEYPHFPFTRKVMSAPRSESEIGSFLGAAYDRCGTQPPYWHPQTHISGSCVTMPRGAIHRAVELMRSLG